MTCRMRSTSSKRKSRRGHHRSNTLTLIRDKNSNVMMPMHRMDYRTGIYKGRQVIEKKNKNEEVSDTKQTEIVQESPSQDKQKK